MENILRANAKTKETLGTILSTYRVDVKVKNIKHVWNVQFLIILNICSPNNVPSKCTKQKISEIQGKMDTYTIIAGILAILSQKWTG